MSTSPFRRKHTEISTILPLKRDAYFSGANYGMENTRSLVEGGKALHGLRGVASIIVVLYHSVLIMSDAVEYGYGYENNTLIHQLPFIRVVFAGRAMIRIFFTLSGYILSFEILRKSKIGLWSHVHETVASAMLRRGIRLFVPPLVTTFITMLLFNVGAFDATTSPSFPTIRRGGSIIPQIFDWITESGRMMNVFRWHTFTIPYNPHLWTLPHEYRGSMLLFGTLTACSRVKLRFRIMVFGIILLNAVVDNHLEVALFFCGSVLAEVVLWKKGLPRTFSMPSSDIRELICFLGFIAGLYLLGFPAYAAAQTPGYHWLARLAPSMLEGHEWWHSVGSVLVVGTVVMSQNLQQPLLNRPIQRLGDISFSVYLIHNPVIRLLIPFWVERLEDIGLTNTLGKAGSYVLLGYVAWPVLLSLSTLVFTWVDQPSMELARWFQNGIQLDYEPVK